MPDGCPALSASFFLAFHRESVDSDLLFSDIIGREAFQVPIPGMKIGTRLGMEGFTRPLIGSLTSDVITVQFK